MKKIDELLQAPLTAHETRWASEIADKLPDDVDLSFEECKILTRMPLREWPAGLLSKVRDVIAAEDFQDDELDS